MINKKSNIKNFIFYNSTIAARTFNASNQEIAGQARNDGYLAFALFFIFLFSGITSLSAQDSVKVFTINDFCAQILKHHPVAKQAALLSEQAKQQLRMSRGVFDPTIYARYYQKRLEGKDYYTLWDNTLTIPIWYGTDFKVGYENNSGINVNGENITPPGGLSYAGISVPLGQGLFIDERRATLQQARFFGSLAEAERLKTINKLMLQAAKDYWDWMYNYNKWQLHKQGYELAEFRLRAVRERAAAGDLAAIDTVEAKIEVQNREVMMNQSLLEYNNSSLVLSNYLWTENNTPLEVPAGVIPSMEGSEIRTLPHDSVQQLLTRAKENHPEVIKLNAKRNQLEIERRFAREKFKPKLNASYNFIQQGFPINPETSFNSAHFNNNYKFGLSFNMPLFLREERGKFELTKLKIQENNFDILQTGREIENSIQSAYNEWLMLENQIRLQEQMVANTKLLRNAEQTRFEGGESSLFLTNSREMSLISNQIKLYELRAKYAKNKIFLQWSAGNVSMCE